MEADGEITPDTQAVAGYVVYRKGGMGRVQGIQSFRYIRQHNVA